MALPQNNSSQGDSSDLTDDLAFSVTSNKKATYDLKCPFCNGFSLTSRGKDKKGRQSYRCKECLRYCHEGTVAKGICPVESDLPCPHCSQYFLRKLGRNNRGYDTYICKACNGHSTTNTIRKALELVEEGLPCPNCKQFRLIHLGKNQWGYDWYRCSDCGRNCTSNSIALAAKQADDDEAGLSEYERDIWDIRKLGIEYEQADYRHSLVFDDIAQPWLKQAIKNYMKLCLATIGAGTCMQRLFVLRKFSTFLTERHPEIQPSQFSRSLILDYLSYMVETGVSVAERNRRLRILNMLLESCLRNEWLNIPLIVYLHPEDIAKEPKSLPRYIPQEVVFQLNQHIELLPPPVMRMVLVIQEVGMRISELCHLKFDCLGQDNQGDWFLSYFQSKLKKEHCVPISRELVQVIQEQQRYIRENLDDTYEYLFCARIGGRARKNFGKFDPKPKPMMRESFAQFLKNLAEENNISTSSGKIWDFQTHQFRHTIGTSMINNKVPHHIVQRYLGHASPGMTSVYAQIFDETLKQEISQFNSKVVNISGQVIKTQTPELDTADLQWFKRNIQAQALPNGSCALPTIQQGCPHANACLTCAHFRTTTEFLDQHKEQLQQTEKILEKARVNEWSRQIEMNERVAENLRNIISVLEDEHNEP